MTDYPQENLLANALSPYLLQHKDNPVHWREWGDEALGEAKQTGKPILLSIGYAACHWCHVMAHESFENPETAELMNRLFVNIKVDREERPDIDQVYMTALHAMGEQGGWPLTMFLTSDGEPFWGGTYFPPESRYGRPGFRDVLQAIAHLAETDQARIKNNTAAIGGHLQQVLSEASTPASASAADLDTIAERLQSSVDPVNGGIGHAPKFPTVTMWETLWRHWLRKGERRALDACVKWIAALCQGGIYDHLGGGIHRYTVDAEWLVPHFEKMLYDNAQFMRTLVLVHGATGEELFRKRIEETVDCLLRDFRLTGGGFASSFDADSEGEEGRYYVWTQDDIDKALGGDSTAFSNAYGVTVAGNWEGKSILNRLGEPLSWDTAKETHLAELRARLFDVRNSRVAPGRDDKVLADWNGLAIRGFAEAGQAFDRPDWIDTARETFDFIMHTMRQDNRLAHAYRDGRMTFPALATDLSSMINAAVSLYAARPDESVLAAARTLADEMEQWHGDGSGGYYLAAADRADLMLRARSEQDEAIPSATAMAIEALARLALVTNSAELQDHAEAAAAAAAAWGRIRANPYASIGIANAIDTVMQPSKLVTIGNDERFAAIAHAHPDPARIDIRAETPIALARLLGSGMTAAPQMKKAAAYLCRGPVCLPPIFDPEALQPLLRPMAPETTS